MLGSLQYQQHRNNWADQQQAAAPIQEHALSKINLPFVLRTICVPDESQYLSIRVLSAVSRCARAAGSQCFAPPASASAHVSAGPACWPVATLRLQASQPEPHMTETLDFSMLKVAPESTSFQRTPRLKHNNPLGTVHDGWFAKLPDSSIGCAFHTQTPVDRVHITAALSANIVQSAPQKMDRFGRLEQCCIATSNWRSPRQACAA